MKSIDVRNCFLNYFRHRQHRIVSSHSVIPSDESALLFVNSGMVPYQNDFLTATKKTANRFASSQRCIRAGGKHNDLNQVGYTSRHHTYFEMLGNFSIGDYYKEQAIYYAWDCLVNSNYFGLDKERLCVTVLESDIETIELWKKISGLSECRIIKLKEDENFWKIGPNGPCGPSSEIFWDHDPLNQYNLDESDRWLELWNLVFMEYRQALDDSKNLVRLPFSSVDTGLGLERLTSVLQNVASNYGTDEFLVLINEINNMVGKYHGRQVREANLGSKTVVDEMKRRNGDIYALRVIADHIRAAVVIIAEGIKPSNSKRGYVLRRILRRAIRFVNSIGIKEPFLFEIVPVALESLGESFDETGHDEIQRVIHYEETIFLEALDRGLYKINSILMSQSVISGADAFHLYDTYGFPLDLTQLIVKDLTGADIDVEQFENLLSQQRERSRMHANTNSPSDPTESVGKTARGFASIESLPANEKIVSSIAHLLKCSDAELLGRIHSVLDRLHDEQKLNELLLRQWEKSLIFNVAKSGKTKALVSYNVLCMVDNKSDEAIFKHLSKKTINTIYKNQGNTLRLQDPDSIHIMLHSNKVVCITSRKLNRMNGITAAAVLRRIMEEAEQHGITLNGGGDSNFAQGQSDSPIQSTLIDLSLQQLL